MVCLTDINVVCTNYKCQLINAVEGNNRSLFWQSNKNRSALRKKKRFYYSKSLVATVATGLYYVAVKFRLQLWLFAIIENS